MSKGVAFFVFIIGCLIIALFSISAYALFCLDMPECFVGLPGSVMLGVIIFQWLSYTVKNL